MKNVFCTLQICAYGSCTANKHWRTRHQPNVAYNWYPNRCKVTFRVFFVEIVPVPFALTALIWNR
jgi:hypothetical protein